MINVSLKQLRALREVCETQNFTAAAKRLHTTQSALSTAIYELEKSLDVKLIDRTTRRFVLTSAGEEFLPAAIRILNDLQASISNLTALAALKRGTVILGAPPLIASTILAGPIATFRKNHPKIDIVLKESTTGRALNRLRSGEVEIVIGTLTEHHADLAVHPWLSDRLVAVVSKESQLAQEKTVTWRLLAGYPIVAPSKESSLQDVIEKTFLKSTKRPFKPVFEASYWTTIVSMVEAGLGVSVIPAYAMKHLSRDTVCQIELTQPVVSRVINIIHHRSRILSPATSAFVNHLKSDNSLSGKIRTAYGAVMPACLK